MGNIYLPPQAELSEDEERSVLNHDVSISSIAKYIRDGRANEVN